MCTRPVHQKKSRKRDYIVEIEDIRNEGRPTSLVPIYIYKSSFLFLLLFLFLLMEDVLDFPKERGSFLPYRIEPA